ncbi:uncharacterized protein B0T23DRAFT_393180 [Neurospora hispaniola]|uniref:Uncharacterized protein n=1 Tax=Neurospora hispaniola TaxID=588809 RepID=A0AAJ0IBT2_9PEZI|nr:hypothetical protein B0T23DRAFT_393180 [Neurospora hispaniola]
MTMLMSVSWAWVADRYQTQSHGWGYCGTRKALRVDVESGVPSPVLGHHRTWSVVTWHLSGIRGDGRARLSWKGHAAPDRNCMGLSPESGTVQEPALAALSRGDTLDIGVPGKDGAGLHVPNKVARWWRAGSRTSHITGPAETVMGLRKRAENKFDQQARCTRQPNLYGRCASPSDKLNTQLHDAHLLPHGDSQVRLRRVATSPNLKQERPSWVQIDGR